MTASATLAAAGISTMEELVVAADTALSSVTHAVKRHIGLLFAERMQADDACPADIKALYAQTARENFGVPDDMTLTEARQCAEVLLREFVGMPGMLRYVAL